MRIGHYVSYRINALYRGLLMGIHLQGSYFCTLGSYVGGELRTHVAPQCRIENVHQMALSPLAQNSYAFVPLVHAQRLTGELNSRSSQLCAECTCDIRIIGRKKRHLGRIGSEKEGLLRGRLHRAENPNSLVHGFVAIANGAKTNGAAADRIGETLNRRAGVDQSCSHYDVARSYLAAVCLGEKPLFFS